MFCNKCGQAIPEGSQFCNSCGAKTVAAAGVPARVAVEDSGVSSYADEHTIFTLRPTLIFVVVRYIVAALILIATAALMGLLSSRVSGTVHSAGGDCPGTEASIA